MIWRFRAYVSASGRNDVQKTIDSYDRYGRAKFERAVAHLAVSPKSQWDEPHGRKLKNEEHKGRVYAPAEAIASAHRRVADIRHRSATTTPVQVNGEVFPPAQ